MDTIYKGLVAPRNNVPAGRPDIPQGERPGTMLVEMVNEAALTGFKRPDQVELAPVLPMAASPSPSRKPSPTMADENDAELTG